MNQTTANQPTIFVSRLLPKPVMVRLAQHFKLKVHAYDRSPTRSELISGLSSADGMIAMLSDPLDEAIFSEAKQLKIISNYAVGFNNIDLPAAKAHGIAVTNTPGVLTEATADLSFALLMSVARRLGEGERLLRQGRWAGWAPTELLGADIYGKKLGLIGIGRIGRAMARRAVGFNLSTSYTARHRLSAREEAALGLSYLSLEELLSQSDFVSLHLPLNPASHHLIDEKAFDRMKKSAFLINTSRGAIVDEKALIRALQSGIIAGAALDVYEHEPRISQDLIDFPQVVLLPHLGSATSQTREKMGIMVIDNLLAYFEGKAPPNLV